MKKAPDFLSRSTLHFYSFFLLIMLLAGCECGQKKTTTPDWTQYLSKGNPTILKENVDRQLIVFIKPGAGRDAFNKFIDSIFISDKKHSLTILPVCGSCDSSVLLLQGSGVKAFVSGEIVKGGSTSKTKAAISGENEIFYYSSNKLIGFDLAQFRKTEVVVPSNIPYSDSVTVAVFDTGLEPGFFQGHLLSDADPSSCIEGAGNGWNFPGWSANWKDDHLGLHGTVVSKFVLNEVERYRKTKAKILPLKVFDSTGTTDLYTLLCGFAFAGKSKADIINSSFGFYESKYKFKNGEATSDTASSALLENFISTYLTQKNKLLLCAAGNRTEEVPDIRDLDKINFFPASLATSLANIIPVTTVGVSEKNQRTVSPTQNFSASVVQLGVDADIIEGEHFGFVNPLDPSLQEIVVGSSFATPVATGKLAAFFNNYKSLLQQPSAITNASRDSIFTILKTVSAPALIISDTALVNKIAGGKVMPRTNVFPLSNQRLPFRKITLENELKVRK